MLGVRRKHSVEVRRTGLRDRQTWGKFSPTSQLGDLGQANLSKSALICKTGIVLPAFVLFCFAQILQAHRAR